MQEGGQNLKFVEKAKGKVTRDLLDTNGVFVLDNGFQIFVWKGKNSKDGIKKMGLHYAQNYMRCHNIPM